MNKVKLGGGLFLLGCMLLPLSFVGGLGASMLPLSLILLAAGGWISYRVYKPGVGAIASMIRCPNCGYEGPAERHTRGSMGVELILWLFFIVPGLIYSMWRLSTRGKVCPRCKWQYIVPAG